MPGAIVVTVAVTFPKVSTSHVVVGTAFGGLPGAGVYVVCSTAVPLGVKPVPGNVNTFGATSPAGTREICGLTFAPVPVSDRLCVVPFALIASVAVRGPMADGLNCVFTVHVDDAGNEPVT